MCMENTAQEGVLYWPRDTQLSAVFFVHKSKRSALSDTYIVLPGNLLCSNF